ncbi:hypothetical protein D3C75_1102930 [compost metagenome]
MERPLVLEVGGQWHKAFGLQLFRRSIQFVQGFGDSRDAGVLKGFFVINDAGGGGTGGDPVDFPAGGLIVLEVNFLV